MKIQYQDIKFFAYYCASRSAIPTAQSDAASRILKRPESGKDAIFVMHPDINSAVSADPPMISAVANRRDSDAVVQLRKSPSSRFCCARSVTKNIITTKQIAQIPMINFKFDFIKFISAPFS